MAFTIRRAEAADVDGIVDAHHGALAPLNDFYAAFFVMPLLEAFRAAAKMALQNANTTFLVAEHTETGAIGGFIRYQIEEAPEEQQADQPKTVATLQPTTTTPPSPWARKEHLEEIWEGLQSRMDEMEACEKQALQGRKHTYIRHLMIHPKWQRQGLGTKLLGEVIAKSDAEGMPCLITSSAESQDLYAKLGFQEHGVWTIDNDHWAKQLVRRERELGITGNEWLVDKYAGVHEVEKCMLREPSSA